MPVQVFTVAEYRQHVMDGEPLPSETTIEIVDSATAIQSLTEAEILALDENDVSLINVTDNALSWSLEQFRSLADDVRFSADDKLTLVDTGGALSNLYADDVEALAKRGVGLIDVSDDDLTIRVEAATALLATNISFDGSDTVTVADSGGKLGLMFFSAPEITTLSNKGVDFISPGDGGSPPPISLRAAQVRALADSKISLTPGGFVFISDDGADIAALSAAQLTKISADSFILIDAVDDVLTLSFAQYKALPVGTSSFIPNDNVTVELSVSEFLGLTDPQWASMTGKGVDALTLKDTGQALATLTPDQISALSSKGVILLDATDNKLTLSLAQYKALGSVKLSATDKVRLSADSDTVLPDGVADLILTDNAIRGTGNGLANIISGNGKNNILAGLGGDDILYGGLGNDRLSGGAGRDVFVFDTKTHKSKNVDKILDFKAKDDSIWLDNAIFKKLGKKGSELKPAKLDKKFFIVGTKAKDKDDYLIYDKKKGSLYYDADGTGKSAQVKIATISNKEKLSYHDFFVI